MQDERSSGRIRTWLFAAMLLSAALAARRAAAEPYMAIREGRKCSACHVNESGAGMRTLFANTHLQEITHYRDLFPELAQATETFNGQITSFLSIGADLRVDDSVVFQDEPDANGAVANGRVFRSHVDENILEVRRAPIYFLVSPIPDYLELYVDESLAPGSPTTREAFGLLKGILPWRGYAKAGRFFADYGLRTANDDMFSIDNTPNNIFVRGRTGTDFTAYVEGGEIGFEPGPFHIAGSVTNGASGNTEVRETFNSYAMLRDLPIVENLMLGGSFIHSAPSSGQRYVYGFYLGSNLGPQFEYQAEVDWIHDHDDMRHKDIGYFLFYGEMNYLLLDWINCKVFGEYSDHDAVANTTHDAQNRFGFGIEPFIGRFLQTSLFYSIANGPEINPPTNQNRLVMELHLFF
jgi:hypothetical protein